MPQWSKRGGLGLWASTSAVLDKDSGAAATLAATYRFGPVEPAVGVIGAHGFLGPMVGATVYPVQGDWILGVGPSIALLFPTIEATRDTEGDALMLLVGELKVGRQLSDALALMFDLSVAYAPSEHYQEFTALAGAGISWRFQ